MNWLVRLTARALAPGECEIVLGDLAECGSSGPRALFDVLGLVVRRQLLIWTSWRPVCADRYCWSFRLLPEPHADPAQHWNL